jgi:CRP-like cAMP-binding protein
MYKLSVIVADAVLQQSSAAIKMTINTNPETTPSDESSLHPTQIPLSERSGAMKIRQMWDLNRENDVIPLLAASRDLSIVDRLDAILMDQRLRWQNGRECRTEVYLTILKHLKLDVSHETAWSLISHEWELAQFYTADCCTIEEMRARFPDFIQEFSELSTEQLPKKTAGELISQPISSDDPTHMILSRDDSTASFQLTGSLQHTNIVELTNDSESTTLEHDGVTQPPTEEFVSPEEKTHQLGACHPFDQLPPSLARSLEERMSPATYETGEFLMREGDEGDGLFLLIDGSVTIRSSAEQQNRILAKVDGRAILGEMALLTDEARTADVIARTPVTGSFLPLEVFEEQATRYPVISRVLTQLFADRLGKRGHDALAGKQLDRFLVKHRLGRGGMAIVYRGTDTSNQADVALKMMSHRLVYDHRALRLFQSEARIIDQFNHPNIVKMVGRFKAFRTMFIAMEFCEGVSLDEIVRETPLEPDRFRIIMAQLASALSYAHSLKIVHRDIKPSNVMVSADNVVKLMDFGLANPIDSIKNDGYLAGTPRYMAPEQAKAEKISERADVFALGCTAYRVLTGESLIEGTTIAEAIEQHENWTMPDVSQFDDDIADFLINSLQVDESKRNVDLAAIEKNWSRKW